MRNNQVRSSCGIICALGLLLALASFAPNAQASPVTFRYYKFTVASNWLNNAYNQVSELHYFSNSVWIPAFTGLPVSTNLPENNWTNANDNVSSTKFGQTGVPYAITYDFGTATTLDSYNWATANDSTPDRNPARWKVEGSRDNVNWTMIDDRTAASQGQGPGITFTWAGTNSGSYVAVGTQNGGAANAFPFSGPQSKITAFATMYGIAKISGNTITIPVPPGTVVTALTPTFTMWDGATCPLASGAPQNFSSPVHYVVTASDSSSTTDYTVSVAFVSSLSLDFLGNGGPAALPSSTVAGVVPLANWNNDGGGIPGTNKTVGPLVDSTATTTPVTFIFTAADAYRSDGATGTPNSDLMKGIVKSQKTGRSLTTFAFSFIPNNYYNLILYSEENTAGAYANFGTIANIGGVTNGVTNYVVSDNYFQGSFVKAENTNSAGARPTGNYVVFKNVVPDTNSQVAFSMFYAGGGSDGCGLAGVQLVPKGVITSASIAPASQTHPAGMAFTCTLTVAGGDAFPEVQWYTNGVAVAGANSFTYTGITPLYGYPAISIYAVLTNIVTSGSITSSIATVTSVLGSSLVLTDQDIGLAAGYPAGWLTDNGSGAFIINGSGSDIWNGSDSFNFAHIPVGGDFDVRVQLTSATGMTDTAGRFGLMVRSSLNAGSRDFMIYRQSDGTMHTMARQQGTWNPPSDVAHGSFSYPLWLRVVRQGSILTSYSSPDGSTWTLRRTEDTSTWSDNQGVGSLAKAAYVGVGIQSHSLNLASGTFSDFTVTGGATIIGGDVLSQDANNASVGGEAGLYQDPNGATLVAGGTGVTGTADSFAFARTTVTGDFDFAVRLDSLGGDQDGAQAGLMVRERLTADSRFIFNFMTLTNGARNSTRRIDGNTAVENTPTTMTLPLWQRLKRLGNLFISYRSQDGVNWIQGNSYDTDDNGIWLHGSIGAPLDSTLYVGCALSSRGSNNAAFAKFSPVVSLLGSTVITLHPSNTVIQAPPQETDSWTYRFSGMVGGTPPVTIQWQKKKVADASFMDIPGATALNYTYSGPQDASDLGAQFRFIATGMGTVTSATATLTNIGLGFNHFEAIGAGLANRSTWTYGITSAEDGSFDVIGGGADIWSTSDSFHYAYDNVTGDFDIKTRMDALIQANGQLWTRGGLMVRQSNSVNAPYIALISKDPHRDIGYYRNYQRNTTGGGNWGSYTEALSTSTGWASYPDNWQRITREGNVFTTYRSRNGTNWNITARFDTSVTSNWPSGPLPAKVMVGFACEGHNSGGWAALARFRNTTLTTAGASGPSWNMAAIHYRKWMDLANGTVADLTNNWKFSGGTNLSRGNNVSDCWPSLPGFADPAPNLNGALTSSQLPNAWAADQFGSVIGGVFTAPVDGTYKFRLGTGTGTDDRSELYLSSNEQRTNLSLVPIAQDNVNGGSNSAPITLVAGGRYWLEAVFKEGTGGNTCVVQVQGPTGSMTNLMADSFVPSYMVGNTVYTNTGLQITQQPVSSWTTNEFKPVTFSVAASVTPLQPLSYQWYSNDVAISSAIGSTYTIPAVRLSDEGLVFKCVVSATGTNLTSTTATLHVQSDTTPPTVLSVRPVFIGTNLALGTPPINLFDVTFSETMDDATASRATNYLLNYGALVTNAVRWSLDGTVYRLVISNLNAELPPTLTFTTNLTDLAANRLAETNFILPVFKALQIGMVRVEYFDSLPVIIVNTWVSDLLRQAAYTNNLPTSVLLTNGLITASTRGDNYGARISGWLIAPFTGSYYFRIYSDDEGRFYLSTDDNPANLPAAATVRYSDGLCCGNQPGYAGGPESGAVNLVAGQRYYFEGLLREAAGGDSWTVTWKRPGDAAYATIASTNIFFGINPYYLGHFTNNVAAKTVLDGSLNAYSIGAVSSEPALVPPNILYQWYSNGVAVAGATNPTAVLQAPVGVNPWTVACVGTARLETGGASPGWGSVIYRFTNSAVQTVVADGVGPVMIAASSDYTTTNIIVSFSEAVDPVTAGNTANYAVDGGVTIKSARRQANGTNVVLATSFLVPSQNYNVTNLGGVKDLSAAQNLSTSSTVPVSKWLLQQGFARVDLFLNDTSAIDAFVVGGRHGTNEPDVSFYTNLFGFNPAATGTETGYNNYAGRVWSYFVPPSNGLYRFFIRSDDDSRLFLNSNPDPALSIVPTGLVQIAAETGANHLYTDFNATPIALNAGQKYLMVGIWKEGTGGDGFSMTFRVGADSVNNPPVDPDWTLGAFFYSYIDPTLTANSISITASPLPATTNVVESVYPTVSYTATAVATPSPAVFYQWQRSDSVTGTFTNMATPVLRGNPVNGYTTPVLHPPTQYYRVVAYALGGASATSAVAQVTFTPDTAAPTLLATAGDPDLGHVILSFSEKMDPVSAQTAANYTMSDGVNVVAATLLPNGSNVVLTTSVQLTNQLYFVTNTAGVKDLSTANSVTILSSFTTWPLLQGYVRAEIFTNQPAGNDMFFLTNSLAYLNNQFSYRTYTNVFGWMVNPTNGAFGNLAEQYGVRASAWFRAPSNGVYRFFVRSDDASEVWMNTNAVDSMNPSGAALIASELVSGHLYTDFSAPISLTGGQLYFMKGLLKEGASTDGLAVTFSVAPVGGTPTTNAPAISQVAPAWLFYTTVDPTFLPSSAILITQQPQPASTNVNEWEYPVVTFTAAAVGTPLPADVLYQWQQTNNVDGFTNIPLAHTASYTTPIIHAATTYRVIASSFTAYATSDVAVVTLNPDGTPPSLLAAVGSPTLTNVLLTFSEILDPVSAANKDNYQIPGLTVDAAVLQGNAAQVVLNTTPQTQGQLYTVTVNGVKDIAASGNTLLDGTANFSAWVQSPGFNIKVELFTGIGAGINVSDLTNSAKYLANQPDVIVYTNYFAWNMFASIANFPSPGYAENYGARISGWFLPPSNGVYRFYSISDDANTLYMNTNAANSTDPAARVPICYISNTWNGVYGALATAISPPITLKAGQQYYMEGLLKEGTGGDGFGMQFTANGALAPASNTSADGNYFTNFGNPDLITSMAFSVNPAPLTTVNEVDRATVTLIALAASSPVLPVYYQWQRYDDTTSAFINVPAPTPWTNGSVSSSWTNLTTPVLYGITGATYRVIADTLGKFATSTLATIVVNLDPVPPVLTNLWYNPVGNLTTLYLSFNKSMSLTSVTNLANYTFDANASAVSATLSSSNIVALTVTQTVVGAHTLALDLRDATYTGNHVITNNVPFTTFNGLYGQVRRDYFLRLNATWTGANNDWSLVTNNAKWPGSPDIVVMTNLLEGGFGANVEIANQADPLYNNVYAMRFVGHIVPSVSGNYFFRTIADDSAQFRLSPDTEATNALTYINAEGGCASCGVGKTNAAPLYLEAGKPYYFDSRFENGAGGHYLYLTWQLPGATNFTTIPSQNLAFIYMVNPGVQPVSVSTNGSALATFSSTVIQTGAAQAPGLVRYQWERSNDNGGSWNPISGATSTSYSIVVTCADDLAQFRLNSTLIGGLTPNTVYTNLPSSSTNVLVALTSTPATLTIQSGGTTPTVVAVRGAMFFTNVYVTFSKLMDSVTANDPANYGLGDGTNTLTVYQATLQPDGSNVVLRTDLQTPGVSYYLTNSGVNDLSCPTPLATASSVTPFTGFTFQMGALAVDVFLNTNGATAADLDGLILGVSLGKQPDYRTTLRSFDWHTMPLSITATPGWDNYGVKVYGWLVPPSNGTYKFYIRGDDATRLYMNTNGSDSAGKVQIARYDACCAGYDAAGASSVGITLTNGTVYYVEGWMKEGAGQDLFQVTFRDASAAIPYSANNGMPSFFWPGEEVATAAYFGLYQNPDGKGQPVTFLQNLSVTPVSVADGASVTFSVLATNPPDARYLRYAWERSWDAGGTWTPIPIPTTNFLCDYQSLGDGTSYTENYYFDTLVRVIVTSVVSGLTATSEVASVTMAAPATFGAVALGSLDGNSVVVVYNKPVDPITAMTKTYYALNGSDVPNTVTLLADGRSVLLTNINTLSGAFTLNIGNAADWFEFGFGAVLDATGTQPYFGSLTGQVVAPNFVGEVGTTPGVVGGNPRLLGSAVSLMAQGVDMVAGGAGIGGVPTTNETLHGAGGIGSTNDGFGFTAWQVSGNFDIKVRVAGMTNRYDNVCNSNALAGLMARPTLTGNSRMIAVEASPAPMSVPYSGSNYVEFLQRDTVGGTAYKPAGGTSSQNVWTGTNNPWARLVRTNDLFTGYYSTNGTDWVLLGSVNTATNAPGSYPQTIYVGLATTSRNNSDNPAAGLLTAKYRDLYKPVPPTATLNPLAPVIDWTNSSIIFTAHIQNEPANSGPTWIKWLKNGNVLPGETTTNLTLSSLSLADSGSIITFLAGNDGGATPVNATLTVTNGLPLVVGESLVATQGVAVAFPAANLLTNDIDPEGYGLTVTAVSGIYPVTFSNNFSAGLPAGTAAYNNGVAGSGTVVTNGTEVFMQLTPAIGTAAGSFIISNLTPNRAVAAFTASFRARVGNGGPTDPADGFSFNFAADLPDGTSITSEEGVGSGLGIGFDNYPLAGPGAPSVKIRWNNTLIATNLIAKMNSTNWFTVRINLMADGKLDVSIDGTNVFNHYQTPFTPIAGRFGFYGRTGGQYETHWIDDVIITAYTLHTGLGSTAVGGTVVLTNGVIAYTPPTNGCGGDSFYYIVNDGQTGGTSIGVVNVSVACLQVSGQLAIEYFAGASRAVTFKLSDTNGTVLATLTPTLTFNNGTASYTVNVPTGTASISAKTDWNLRKKLAADFGGGITATADFTGNSALPAGDITGDDAVTLADYYLLASLWYTSGPIADLDGNGKVDMDDYFLLANRWLQTGDAP